MEFLFEITPLCEEHNTIDFDCGDKDLNEFIKKDALKQKKEGWNTTYVATEIGCKKVIGFFALSQDSITISSETKRKFGNEYTSIPAIKIGRFAVDKKYQNKGIGQYILKYAIGFIIQNICPLIGGIYITLDAYSNKSEWYKKHFNFRKNTLIEYNGTHFESLIFPIKDFKLD